MFDFFGKKRTVYADYAAATPLDPEVKEAMLPYLSAHENFGNPASIHHVGREAKKALEDARDSIARVLSVQSDEIIFTSGGTESNNLAIFGILEPLRNKNPHVITSPIEHSAILEPIKFFEAKGAKVSYVSVDAKGRVEQSELEDALQNGSALLSLAYVNGELGTIEKIRETSRLARKHRDTQMPYVHTDASQAFLYLKILPNDLGVDLLTLDAGKIHGPKGVGLLFVKRGTPLSPFFRGGLQERGLRSGTQNVAGIVGFAAALCKADKLRESEIKRLLSLRDELKKKILSFIPQASVNGEGNTLPNFLNICIPEVDAEFLSVRLDREGVCVSSASACRSISGSGSSYVIESLPGRFDCSKSSLRISLGRETTSTHISRIALSLERLLKSRN